METKESLSHDCRSHGPISPMDGCAALSGDISEVDGGVALSLTPGIAIPGTSTPPMSIPAIASAEPADAVVDSHAWQSELAIANAHERSQAAAIDVTASNRTAIEPAIVRFRFISLSILRPNHSRLQMGGATALTRRPAGTWRPEAHFTVLFSAQTYSLIDQSECNLKVFVAVHGLA